MRRRAAFAWCFFIGLATVAAGAARARLGGTLAVGLVGIPSSALDAPESPEAYSARTLLALPLCRLLPERHDVLVTQTRPAADEVRLVPLAGARFADGRPLDAEGLARSLRQLLREQSPYLALLAPVAHLDAFLAAAAAPADGSLALKLGYPWPDLEASLCHPAFTPLAASSPNGPVQGVGLYVRGKEGSFLPSHGLPRGPPYPGALTLASLGERAAARLLQRGELEAVLGAGASPEDAPLFATYLVFRPGGLSDGARLALAQLDVAALVRTFVPGPSLPLRALLPPSLLGAEATPVPPAAPAKAVPSGPTRGFSLGYETALPEQRAVAERLQVVLHDAGFAVTLHADSREGLQRARAAGTLDAALVSVLLPPVPAPALAVVLGLVLEREQLDRELLLLGAVAEPHARAALATERARALASTLPLVPLYVRGLRMQQRDSLLGARRDAFGLLVLDDAWLAR